MSWALASAEKLCVCLDDKDTAAVAHCARLRLDKQPHDPDGLLQGAALMAIARTMASKTAAKDYILKKKGVLQDSVWNKVWR